MCYKFYSTTKIYIYRGKSDIFWSLPKRTPEVLAAYGPVHMQPVPHNVVHFHLLKN